MQQKGHEEFSMLVKKPSEKLHRNPYQLESKHKGSVLYKQDSR